MRKFLLLFLMTGAAMGQTLQTYTGVIKDLSQQVVTSGQVNFTLTPPTDSTLPGIGRFTPSVINCSINTDGTLSGFVAGVVSGACVVTANTSISPAGTAYRICLQPQFATPGSCFYDYALGGTKDITTIVPTLTTGPLNYGGVPGPPGCVVGTNCTANLTPLSVNTVYYASMFQAADVGAQINLADFAAGSGPADIVVTVPGTVTTVPTISSNHRLILAAPLTWGSVAPIMSSNSQIIGTGSNAVQTVSLASTTPGVVTSWIIATNLTNLEIDNLWVTNTSVSITEGTTIFTCNSCTGITMKNNHGVGIGVIQTNSTAATYAAVNSTNLTQNVYLEGNYVDGNEFGNTQLSRVITLANIRFTQNVTMVGNDIINGEYGLEWWGGDAFANGNNHTNTRWAKNISVVGGHATNVTSGWWGSMGVNITVAGVTADGCLDLCLDTESSSYVDYPGFTVHDGGPTNISSGALGVFFASDHITFGPGVVTEDTAAWSHIFVHNANQDPTLEHDITFHDIHFVCNDPATPCPMKFDAIGSLRFYDNTVVNSFMSFNSPSNSDYEISRNNFYVPISQSNTIISIPGQLNALSTSSRIEGNNFFSSVVQPAGTYAIQATITDFNFPDRLYVTNNRTFNFTNDAQFIADSANTGIIPTFIFDGNSWGSNSVTKTISGALGSFSGVNTTQIATASACSAAANTQCGPVTVALPRAEPDTGYHVSCSGENTSLVPVDPSGFSTSQFLIFGFNVGTAAISGGTFSCTVTH